MIRFDGCECDQTWIMVRNHAWSEIMHSSNILELPINFFCRELRLWQKKFLLFGVSGVETRDCGRTERRARRAVPKGCGA